MNDFDDSIHEALRDQVDRLHNELAQTKAERDALLAPTRKNELTLVAWIKRYKARLETIEKISQEVVYHYTHNRDLQMREAIQNLQLILSSK